jgi:hypothetical protein
MLPLRREENARDRGMKGAASRARTTEKACAAMMSFRRQKIISAVARRGIGPFYRENLLDRSVGTAENYSPEIPQSGV